MESLCEAALGPDPASLETFPFHAVIIQGSRNSPKSKTLPGNHFSLRFFKSLQLLFKKKREKEIMFLIIIVIVQKYRLDTRWRPLTWSCIGQDSKKEEGAEYAAEGRFLQELARAKVQQSALFRGFNKLRMSKNLSTYLRGVGQLKNLKMLLPAPP